MPATAVWRIAGPRTGLGAVEKWIGAAVLNGDKTITYYIKDKGKGEKYHKCSGEQDAKVTGKVSKDGDKMVITDAKVEKK